MDVMLVISDGLTKVELFRGQQPEFEKLQRLSESFFAGRKATTKEAYKQDLNYFSKFLGFERVEDASSHLVCLNHGDANLLILNYKAHLKENGFASSTINRRLASIRSLVKFARTIGLISWSLEVENESSVPYRDTTGIQPEIFKILLRKSAAQRNQFKALRDVAILRLMFDLGLRRAEVASLDFEDIDIEEATIQVLGKGRNEKQTLTLSVQSRDAVAAYVHVLNNCTGPLFTDCDRAKKNSGRITNGGLTFLVKSLGKKIGISLHPHKLRHSAITQACKLAQQNSIDLEEVLDFSRHKDLRTLMIYRDRERNVQGVLATLVGSSV